MFNFRKISAIGASALLLGMSAGFATAANYPAPFVVGGNADVAVVYGTGSGVSLLDAVEAGNIQSNLQSFMGGSSSGTSTTTSGETVSLDTSSSRIWLNTSLNTAKSTLTKTDLPTVLEDYTFDGDVSSKLTSTIKLTAGSAATSESDANTGTVIFSKQPKSTNDPVIGISLGTSETDDILYNASATMSAINFTHADSVGEEIQLFGQKFTVSSDTDLTDLVLLKEAHKINLDTDNPTAAVTVAGADYTIELVSASDTAATIRVVNSAGTSEQKEVSEADSKKVNGIQVAVQTADETNLKLSASIIAGAQKLTLSSGSSITEGDNADPIDGTFAYVVGGPNATTEIAVAVSRPDSSNDAILPGESFVDPVFGSFKVDFAGLSSPLDDSNREDITVGTSGDDSMSLTMTDSEGNTKTIEIAHNATYASEQANTPVEVPANLRLADDSNFTIFPHEGANLTEDDYTIVGNEDYGHLVQVIQIYNNTGTDYTKDEVKLQDMFSGENYASTFTSEGHGTVSIDGKQYTVTFLGSGDTGYATVKFPTGDSSTTHTWVLYPTIETKNGGNLALYEPLNISLDGVNATEGSNQDPVTVLNFPDGDGYTSLTLTYAGNGTAGYNYWAVTGAATTTLNASSVGNSTSFTIGQFTYNLSAETNGVSNRSVIYLLNPEDTTSNLAEPGVILFEGKDDNNAYEGIVVDFESAPAGTSTDGVGVNDVFFTTSYYHQSASLASDSDFTEDVDWYGTKTSKDASDSDQTAVTISYPKSQVYAQIYIGEEGSSVSSSTTSTSASQLGDVLVKDTEVSSVQSKNLIVVGGSCINSAAAKVLSAGCGAGFTEQTGVGSGQFLIQSVGDAYTTGKVALVVAGYEVADTVNAAKYLRSKTVDTTAGKKYIGTTSTSAELQVA